MGLSRGADDGTTQSIAPRAGYPEAENVIASVVQNAAGHDFFVPLSMRHDIARRAIEALRALPVEKRMEAMGMEPVGLAHQMCSLVECVHYGEVPAHEQ